MPDSVPVPLDLLAETRSAKNGMPDEKQKHTGQSGSCAKMAAPEKSERDREIEMIERKFKAARALIEEGLNRLKELKAA